MAGHGRHDQLRVLAARCAARVATIKGSGSTAASGLQSEAAIRKSCTESAFLAGECPTGAPPACWFLMGPTMPALRQSTELGSAASRRYQYRSMSCSLPCLQRLFTFQVVPSYSAA
jgi:hypothetical protein